MRVYEFDLVGIYFNIYVSRDVRSCMFNYFFLMKLKWFSLYYVL